MNASGDKYFYNVQFETGEVVGIPGFTVIPLILSALGTVAFLFYYKKRN
jgi:hypothetical protein